MDIDKSKILLGQAYEAILGIEELDIDVSDLLYTFNNAADLLSKAQLAFDEENMNDARIYTKSVIEISESLIDEVEKMKIDAVVSQDHELLMVLLVSVLGVSIVVVIGMVAYRMFKKKYFNIV